VQRLVSLTRHLEAEDVETLRAYVIPRAHEKKRLASP
jgi:hypothetical protein